VRKLIVFVLAVSCGTVIAAAQQKPQHSDRWEVFGGYSFARVYGSPNIYSETPDESGDEFAPFNQNGGEASVTYYLKKHFGITADFADLTKSQSRTFSGDPDYTITQTEHVQEYLFGPTVRFGFKNEKLQRMSFFAHQLFGVAHASLKLTSTDEGDSGCFDESSNSCSGNPFTLASGGGVDIRMSRHISVRPFQMDYWSRQLSPKAFGESSIDQSVKLGVDGFRYSAGAVVNF
jgi:hypothetical protein